MPDTPIDPNAPIPRDPMLEARMTHVEGEVRDIKSILGQMLPVLIRLDATVTATLPHLATKADLNGEVGGLRGEMHTELGKVRADLAEKPSKVYLWGILATLIATYAAGLAGLGLLLQLHH